MTKKSIYNLELEKFGSILIYNTRVAKLIELDSLEYYYWKEDFCKLNPNTYQWLYDNGFIVDSDFDEAQSIIDDYVVDSKKVVAPYFRVLTTTACNAHCSYCFESGMKKTSMTAETAEAVCNFIKTIPNESNKPIRLEWFGGEPLINHKVITQICRSLSEASLSNGFESEITSNGLLFNQITPNDLKEWNLKNVQITLDGTHDIHNSIKNYSGSIDGFDKTIDSIHYLINNNVSVTIRLNFSDENVPDMLSLIDFVYNEFGNTVQVYGSQIYEVGNVSEHYVKGFAENIFLKKLYDCGYYSPRRTLMRSRITCGLASYPNYYVIDPDGNLYKCVESMAFSKESKIGTIYGNSDQTKIDFWWNPVVEKRCLECIYLPMCVGGCVAARHGWNSMRCFRYKRQVENLIRELDMLSNI